MRVLIISSIISMALAQFDLDDVDLTTRKPWIGPFADHHVGVHPSDTAEVTAAKAYHLKAFQEAAAKLPELPPEDRYRTEDDGVYLTEEEIIAIKKRNEDHLTRVNIQQAGQPIKSPVLQNSRAPLPKSANVLRPTYTPEPVHIFNPVHIRTPEPVHIFEPIEVPDFVGLESSQFSKPVQKKWPGVFAEEIPLSPIGETPEVYAARIAHMKAHQEARGK